MNKAEAPVITCQILVILFDVQQFGTDKVGFAFAPIILLWFAFISGIGVYNLITHGVIVLRAFNLDLLAHHQFLCRIPLFLFLNFIQSSLLW
ncbi:unnamed protein product [Prunus armeniaca]|uniref:K+ potassium transporter integral membrane domain-containing protein n=1 Tax=Prunus armeniaca TaxID=36596 RepID=A0A6J5TJR0_PRUAR|nr:unnamed protein product [Prunus armeniaca]CAB4294499.1 unnamed protein product [Prunus armeniaca]